MSKRRNRGERAAAAAGSVARSVRAPRALRAEREEAPPRPDPAGLGAPSPWPPAALAGAFFLSGASALIYELLWFRLLGHIFGSTATATSTLLASYLFGLGIGAWIFGKLSDRIERLALMYVVVEVAIGAFGIASHALFERGAALYAIGYSWAEGSPGALLLTRFLVSFVLVAIPTTLMGGTFPLMVQLLKAERVDVGRATGRAYAINTAGAALGTLALPALLMPALGVARSLLLAALGNFAAAVLTFVQSRRPRLAETGEALPPDEDPSHPSGPAPAIPVAAPVPAAAPSPAPARSRLAAAPMPSAHASSLPLLGGFFLSSFAALALETVWTRHLSIHFGAQIFTFAFVLFGYLVGLFIGGAAYARLLGAGIEPERIYRSGLLLSAASVAIPLPFLGLILIPQLELMVRIGVSNQSFLITSGLVIVGLILLPAIGFGVVFPAIVDLLSRGGRRTGESVAVTYVINTAGTTLGAMAAGFLLVPALGSQRTIELCVLLIAGAFALSWRMDDPAARRASGGLRYGVAVLFLVLLFLPRWDWRIAHGQYSKDPLSFVEKYRSGQIWQQVAGYKLPYFREGTEATVSVARILDKWNILYVNGKPDASNYPDDMVAQRLVACLPGLFHPDPKRALVIGVGSGTTVGTLKRFPLEQIDAAEISPEVNEAARIHFTDVNDRFLEDPRISLHLDDGRNFLHFRPSASYDIIISEPSNPWMTGVSALFTDEFFAEMKDRLRPGGICCQWFHYYNMSLDHIRLLTRTFRRHFPESALFVVRGANPTGDIVIVGSNSPLRMLRLPEDRSLPESVRAALTEIRNGSTQQLLSGLVVAPEGFAAFGRSGRINTDDLPILEFEAPADRFGVDFMENLRQLLTFSERSYLPAGPTAEQSPPARELARDGFAPTRGLPPGEEVKRGVTVLTRFRQSGDDLSRWALHGREFEQAGTSTALWRLARPVARPDEFVDIATSLAGSGVISRNEIKVNDHAGIAVHADTTAHRTIVIGWNCPFRNQAFFVAENSPPAGAGDDPEKAVPAAAAALAAAYPCMH